MADSAAHGRQIAALNNLAPCGANTVGKDDSESLDHDLNSTNHPHTMGCDPEGTPPSGDGVLFEAAVTKYKLRDHGTAWYERQQRLK